MNIFLHELQIQKKSFLFWCIGLFLLVFAGMTKYSGISASKGIDINSIMDQFPRVVLAVLGILGLNANSLDGYYAMMSFYSLICACIYASFLGSGTILREIMDKTQDFIFTKPYSRTYIILQKCLANIFLLTLFCLVNFISSILAVNSLSAKQDITLTITYFSVTVYIVALIFFFCSAFLSAIQKNAQKGASYGMYVFLITFLLGIISQMTDSTKFLRIFSPMRYFLPTQLLNHHISIPYLLVCLLFMILFCFGTFFSFQKKDLFAS